MSLEDEIREQLEQASAEVSGLPVRHAIRSMDDPETRLVKLELAVTAQRDALLRLAREIENLSAKGG